MLFQYGNPANPLAHYEGRARRSGATAPRSTCSSPGSARAARSWASAGTSRSRSPRCGSSRSSRPAGELVQGLRSLEDGFVPPIFDPAVLDRKFIVRPRESIEWTRRLLDECGVFAGISSGAAMAGAAKMAATMDAGTIVTLAARRRMEVPLVGRVDRRPRRRRPSAPNASTTGSEAASPSHDGA